MTNWKIFCSYFTENRCDYHVSVCTIINDPFLPEMMPCGNCYCPSATSRCCCRYVSCFCTYIHLLLSRTLSVISFNLFRSFPQDLLTKISYSASLSLSGSSLVLGVVGGGGEGGTPSNGLCGEAPPGRGTNFRRQVYERVRTSLGTYKVYILGIYV